MTEFSESKTAYRAAAQAVADGRDAVVAAAERVKAIERALQGAARRPAAEGDDGHALAELQGELRMARAEAAEARGHLVDARAAAGSALAGFGRLADPVKAVEHLPDDVPIALFPLRLETRYKTVGQADGTDHLQLWVRAFPDDILVDGFQPEISRAELDNLRIYWTHRWRAGGDAQGRRAAWLALARSHGAGRAQWLLGQYAPVNATDEPVVAAGEHLLVIRTESTVPASELGDIGAYWARVWSTGGAEVEDAYDDLRAQLGQARADEVVATLVPVNLYDVDVRPSESVTPRVVLLQLPDPAVLPTSAEDWTRGARAWMLPERLVVTGFRGGRAVFSETGRPIPPDLRVGPDPSDAEDDQVRAGGPDLVVSEAMDWTVDFDAAVTKGMGVVIDLTERAVDPRLDRLFVVGLRLASDADEGAAELETLIGHHQASRKGFTLVRQGQPTNNTEESRAGYSWWEDDNTAYDHFHPSSPHADPADWRERRDGAWLSGLLGLDPGVLQQSPGYYGTEQAEARAMNNALWPATLGYFMEQLMEPVFSETTTAQTRAFFCRHVVGRGTTPLVRVGRQPYGFLPATAWSRLAFPGRDQGLAVNGGSSASYLNRLHALVERAVGIWSSLAGDVSYVGDPGPDPQQTLLDLLGLHPGSVEFHQRYSQSFTQYYNLMGLESELVSSGVTAQGVAYVEAGLAALSQLGWEPPAEGDLPALLEKIFLKKANLLTGDLVCPELSEVDGLPVDRADGLNYLAWLVTAARTSHDTLRKQEGFTEGVPTALLYQMLRHALDLGFVDSGLTLRRDALQWDDMTYRAQRKEPLHLAIAEPGAASSRWAPLYAAEQAVTGDAELLLGDYIPSVVESQGHFLADQLQALELLEDTPTARLERAFVEHLDCLSYRLDAWRLGLSSVQLSLLRQESDEGFAKRGLHLGAYGWVENLAPRPDTRETVELDTDLAAVFEDATAEPVQRDEGNHGHVHAPSLDQAVTAGILRAGHLAHATPGAPEALAVDLTSERVRLAMEVIEGMRDGQALGALLGYRLERALHDEPSLFLDRLVYDLRRAFPLVGNHNLTTHVAGLARIQQVEARHVVDGAALSRHIDETGAETYPYALDLPSLSDFTGPGLPSAAAIGDLVDAAVAKMRSVADAVSDLAVAEGVYQVVRGNHDKAAGSMDAFSKGTYPPSVEVAATPRSGRALTHRIGLHLAAGLTPGAGGLTNPREQGEPALARWLAAQLPDPASVKARVSWSKPDGTTDTLTVSMQQLGLAAADLFYLVDAAGARDMAAFDELLIDHAQARGLPAPRDDAQFSIEYRLPGVVGTTLFETAPLIRALRGLVLGARPLRATDLELNNEASRGDDQVVLPRTDKVTAVRGLLAVRQAPIQSFVATLDAAVGPSVADGAAADAARDQVDQWVADYADLVRPLVPFGLRSGGLTAGIEGRRAPYAAMQKTLAELHDRWTRYAEEYDAVMSEYAALPAAASNERRAKLLRAASLVSTAVIAPLPADLDDLEDAVADVRDDFDDATSALGLLRTSNDRCGDLLQAITGFRSTVAAHDLTPFDIEPLRRSVLALARDLLARAQQLGDDVTARLAAAGDGLADAALTTGDRAHQALVQAQQAVLGQDFVLLPEFGLPAAPRSEWQRAWDDRLAILEHHTTPADGTPFPLDDWLTGVARVRERMRHLETAAMLAPVAGAGSLELTGVQLPYLADDVWLGLDFPATFRGGRPFALEGDRLLYTAHFATGSLIDPAQPAQSLCGLLVDEWLEVVPGTTETTGLGFHYDRPGTEAPQAVLLVTPPVPGQGWRWDDIVDAMHETLDLARLRAVEPDQLAQTTLGPLLPAVLASVTMLPITAMLNFSLNNDLHLELAKGDR